MRSVNKRCFKAAISVVGLAIGFQSAGMAADMEDKLQIHGYGYQGYLQASDNEYLGVDDKGTWDANALALVFIATVDDKSKIWMQLHGTAEKVRVDWAFVDYQASANLTLRGGQIKLPVGLYNEIRDIEFLHLSTLDPALYQEASEMTDESFRGVSVVYTVGSLSLDGYVGQTVDVEESAINKYRRLLGGRVTYKTPVDGLRFMASAYDSQAEEIATGAESSKNTWVLSADYTENNFDLKAEVAAMKFFGEKSKTYYTQAGYTFVDKWTPFVRYDYITTDTAESSDPSHYQKTATVGLGYKINSSVGVRIENQWNRGYALPVASGEVAAGTGKIDWTLFAANINFIF